jgi:hypothetical protein
MKFKQQYEAHQINKIHDKAEQQGIYVALEVMRLADRFPEGKSVEISVQKAPRRISTENWLNRIGCTAEDYIYEVDEILGEYVQFELEKCIGAESRKIHQSKWQNSNNGSKVWQNSLLHGSYCCRTTRPNYRFLVYSWVLSK